MSDLELTMNHNCNEHETFKKLRLGYSKHLYWGGREERWGDRVTWGPGRIYEPIMEAIKLWYSWDKFLNDCRENYSAVGNPGLDVPVHISSGVSWVLQAGSSSLSSSSRQSSITSGRLWITWNNQFSPASAVGIFLSPSTTFLPPR